MKKNANENVATKTAKVIDRDLLVKEVEGLNLNITAKFWEKAPNLVTFQIDLGGARPFTLQEVYFGKKDFRIATRQRYLVDTGIHYVEVHNWTDAGINAVPYTKEGEELFLLVLKKSVETEIAIREAKAKAKADKKALKTKAEPKTETPKPSTKKTGAKKA